MAVTDVIQETYEEVYGEGARPPSISEEEWEAAGGSRGAMPPPPVEAPSRLRSFVRKVFVLGALGGATYGILRWRGIV